MLQEKTCPQKNRKSNINKKKQQAGLKKKHFIMRVGKIKILSMVMVKHRHE